MRFIALFVMFACSAVNGCSAAQAAATTRPMKPAPTTQPGEAQYDGPSAAEYVEYRAQPEVGSITFQTGIVRGHKRVADFEKHGKSLPDKGIFPLIDDDAKRRIYRRQEKMDGRKIEAVVVIDPPAADEPAPDKAKPPAPGEEPSDAPPNSTARLLVRIDGRLKIACTLGTSMDGELWIHRITIHPEDGTIDIIALSEDGEELSLPDSWLGIDDPTLITDGLFFQDDPDPPGKGPIKV